MVDQPRYFLPQELYEANAAEVPVSLGHRDHRLAGTFSIEEPVPELRLEQVD